MAVEAEELYFNLNQLLADICKFLTNETNYENLSPYARKKADELIKRSKQQLQEIAKVAPENEYDGAYVDMERKPPSAPDSDNDDENNIYSSVEESVAPQAKLDPYSDLPARELSRETKYGNISWKTKNILNFDKMRRVFGGIHDNWFLIYSSEKDAKPLLTLHLKTHKASTSKCKQGKNLPQMFELSCVTEDKTFVFMALAHKDMLQWIAHINRCHESFAKPPSTNHHLRLTTTKVEEDSDTVSETYDSIMEISKEKKNSESSSEEEIYNDIITITTPREVPKPVLPPDLPLRRPMKDAPLPPIPTRKANSLESQETNHDPVHPESENSFSDVDDEDVIYEPFVVLPNENKPVAQPSTLARRSDVSETSSSDSNITPSKPAVKEKPKYLLSFKRR